MLENVQVPVSLRYIGGKGHDICFPSNRFFSILAETWNAETEKANFNDEKSVEVHHIHTILLFFQFESFFRIKS